MFHYSIFSAASPSSQYSI